MPPPLTPADAQQPEPSWAVMLGRGARRRCPRCGGGRLFRTWWAIRDRCPRCGLLFAREPGYFTGVYLVNLTAVLVPLFVVVMGFALWRGTHPDGPLLPFLVAGAVIGVIWPVLTYPFARTVWSALDLAMTPMDVREILDAVEATDDEGPGDAPGGRGRPAPPSPPPPPG